MKRILCVLLFVALGVQVRGDISLRTGDEDVESLTVEVGLVYDISVFSDDSSYYDVSIGFSRTEIHGEFVHTETTPEAGDLAGVTEYNVDVFSGYYIDTDSLNVETSPGVHFVFEYRPSQIGTVTLRMYDGKRLERILDSLEIRIVPQKNTAAFTYQGRLHDSGDPADGFYDIQFALFDQSDPNMSNPKGLVIEMDDVEFNDGYFQTELDFGEGILNGDMRWLEIAVRPGDSTEPNEFVILEDRQQLTAGPYAVHAASAGDAASLGGRTIEDFALTEDVSKLEDRIAELEAIISTQNEAVMQLIGILDGVTRDANDIILSGVNLCIVNGTGDTEEVNGLGNLIVGHNKLRASGNIRTGSHNIIVGGEQNYSSYGGLILGFHNTIGGEYASVSGGTGNSALGLFSSVTGGVDNLAEGNCAIVTGGYTNTAGGYASAILAGYLNIASSDYSLVSGGRENTAEGYWATITGGFENTARGNYSSISGGWGETVEGEYDWRAGNNYFADE
jgi:hypothetical protein